MPHSISSQRRRESQHTGIAQQLSDQALRSDIAIVYTSGDSAGDWPSEGLPHSLILQKPFADAQLVTAISTLINEAGSQP
jgi:hypothetical protein